MFTPADVEIAIYRLEAFETLNNKFDEFIDLLSDFLDNNENYKIETGEVNGHIAIEIFFIPIVLQLAMILDDAQNPLGKLCFFKKMPLDSKNEYEQIWEIYFDETGRFKSDSAENFHPYVLTENRGVEYCLIKLVDIMMAK